MSYCNKNFKWNEKKWLIATKLQQEMPSCQQKSAKNGPEIYLLIGLYHILVILRSDDGNFHDQKNVHSRFFKKPRADSLLNRCKQLLSLSKLRSCEEVQILKKFTKSSKALCLGVLERKTWLAAPSKVQVLHHRLGKQVCRKENKEHINAKDICQIFQIYRWMLFPDE